ncbi:hypothetical protein C9994_05200 [Marivirga lumbricoides]|uniref:Secretion system C-terminal sorting domain-containing protein n=1 Tax=Marivirga lumbricoides TaxID=1046115 RepID=A0A2T4DSY7_9BACT|nr:hypothetical protein C9994_05200 [Marivirga lumbricoides]
MKRQYSFLIIISCFCLSALGQEMRTSVLNEYSVRGLTDPFSANRLDPQNLKTKHVYKEKLDSIIEYNYDEVTGSWNKRFTKKTFTYDDDLNEILWVFSSWNATDSIWVNHLKEETQYNEIENKTVNTRFVWAREQWNKETKWEFIYNQNDELIQRISYQWKYDLQDWLLTERWEYSYNDQRKPLTDSLYWWYPSSEEWKLRERIDYEYINDKELHYIFYSNWDSNTKQWIESKKDWYLYDLQWRLYTLSNYEWDDKKEDNWKLTNRQYYSYDDNDYLKKYANVAIKPRDDGSIQHELMYEKYEFDFSMVFNDILLPNYLNQQEFKYHHKLLNTSLSQYNHDRKQEEKYRNVEFYYSPIDVKVTDNDDFLSENISIYPNPAMESIHINYPNEFARVLFELYDINGKKIISTSVNKAESIDISTLRKGLYLYHIRSDKYKSVGRLIKE